MEELIYGNEYCFDEIEHFAKKNKGYHHQHGPSPNHKDPNIGELMIILYFDNNPAAVYTFFLINVSGSAKYNRYRLIYKYTGL